MKTSFVFQLLTLTLILTVLALTVNARSISDKDLVIYYSFDDASLKGEDILDVSGNENDGFLHGNNLKIVDEGKFNECMEFPGEATEYISVRNLNYTEGIPELSIAVWIKTADRGMIAS
jgi:hypothetical protein